MKGENPIKSHSVAGEYSRKVTVICDYKTGEPLEVCGAKSTAWRFLHVEGSTFYLKATKKTGDKLTELDSYSTFQQVLARKGKVTVEINMPGNKQTRFTCYQMTIK